MSEADTLKEDYPRAYQDYYAAHGHSERVYAIKPVLDHLLAGLQYALAI